MEYTLAIIKPDAVKAKNAGKIIDAIEAHGFNIVYMEKRLLSAIESKDFYAVHKDRPFYGELTEFMSSGPVIVMALEKNNAVADWRKLMGATNPKEAAEGTIRKQFAKNIGENAVHGSDSAENAVTELKFFFPDL
jgi:nucleoside-diphosphate kinase